MNENTLSKILSVLLREAAAYDVIGVVPFLVNAGANPYDADKNGRTAFNRAASNGLRALDWLTTTAFADTQKPAAQRRWKNYGINTPSGAYGSTLITYAAKVSHVALVGKMIDAGADISITNGSGWTLLHCAAVMPGRAEVLRKLLQVFRQQGLADKIDALTTHVYETAYKGHKVVFGTGLTAAGLCRARMEQDSSCPRELYRYLAIFSETSGG
ncbi:MAG: ankyrin repeat domain-containing protein [Alphaproteobacteria bacterium]